MPDLAREEVWRSQGATAYAGGGARNVATVLAAHLHESSVAAGVVLELPAPRLPAGVVALPWAYRSPVLDALCRFGAYGLRDARLWVVAVAEVVDSYRGGRRPWVAGEQTAITGECTLRVERGRFLLLLQGCTAAELVAFCAREAAA